MSAVSKGRGKFILGSLLILILGAGIGFGVFWFQRPSKQPAKKESITAQQKASQLPGSINDVQNLRQTGKTTEAEQLILQKLKNSSLSSDDRSLLYAQLGFIQSDRKDYAAALDSYQKAADAKADYSIYEIMGDLAIQMGNKTQAIEFYKKAISLIPSDYPNQNLKTSFEDKIKAAGGQL